MRCATLVFVACLFGATCAALGAEAAHAAERFSALVFSQTAGYRHASIPEGIVAIKTLAHDNGFHIDASEDPAVFTAAKLARYRVVIFLNTSGNILDAGQRAAFQAFVRHGGGFVGIHAAADTGYDWPWYGRLVGSYFQSHPAIQPATLQVVAATHPSTRHLPADWRRTDEWYNFRSDPGADVAVLLRIDEDSYAGGTMGGKHPMAWCHSLEGGRAWYTALGHTSTSYQEPLFLQHLLGGILWAARVAQD